MEFVNALLTAILMASFAVRNAFFFCDFKFKLTLKIQVMKKDYGQECKSDTECNLLLNCLASATFTNICRCDSNMRWTGRFCGKSEL